MREHIRRYSAMLKKMTGAKTPILNLIKIEELSSLAETPTQIKDAIKKILDTTVTAEQINYVVDKMHPMARANYITIPNLLLTNTFQRVLGWTSPYTIHLNIDEDNGVFTPLVSGVYEWTLERIYLNYDKNPVIPPVKIFIEVRKNGVMVIEREAEISAATANDEPGSNEYTSTYQFSATANDEFEFYVKALDGTASPSNTRLYLMQIAVKKIDEL